MLGQIKFRSCNPACRNSASSTACLHTCWICSTVSVYITELPEAVAITVWTKWDFEHFLNYHGAAVAIHLIQRQFLRSNSIKADGVGFSPEQNEYRNFLRNNRQWRPHQEPKQFQNSHFRSRCPLRAQSHSKWNCRRCEWLARVCLIQHAKKGGAGWLTTRFFSIFNRDILYVKNTQISEKDFRNYFPFRAHGEMKWVMGQRNEKLQRGGGR